jgi:ubiquinone/menaquinone biosynthesis C-methylase UbiE
VERPAHLGREYAAQFREREVVHAYAARPPYPAQVFETLRRLLPAHGGRVLELGCGTGDLTFSLAPLVRELVAIDPAPAMLATATRRFAQVPPNVRFVLASAEDFEPRGVFSLLVAAESLHWMDWDRVLPRLKRHLSPGALLAIIDARHYTDVPWSRDLQPLLAAFSTNREYQPYDLIALLTERGLFSERGRLLASEAGFRQELAAYVESFHSRNGFSRARMGDSAARFDQAVRELVLQHRPDGFVEGTIAATVVWGELLGS